MIQTEILNRLMRSDFVPYGCLLKETSERCVDGRGKEKTIGLFGGNAGEFVLACHVYEQITGKELTKEEILAILIRYIGFTGKFYFHSDIHAEHDEEKGNNAIGCGHLRKMTEYMEKYGVRPELIKDFIQAFHFLKNGDYSNDEWGKAAQQLEYEILEGEHKEQAVTVVIIENFDENSQVPILTPSEDNIQTFVFYPQVAALMRKTVAENVRAIFAYENIDIQNFLEMLNSEGEKFQNLTLGFLAPNLPVITVVYNKNKPENERFTIQQPAT